MLRKLLIGTASLIALFAIAGSALLFAQPTAAQSGNATFANAFGDRAGQFGDGPRGNFAFHRGGGAPVDNPQFVEKVAEHLGMTVEALQTELDAGKTLPQIAEEQGVDLPQKRGRGGHHGGKGRAAFANINRQQIVADALGITVEELQAAKESGTTMEELAAANNTTVDAIKDAMMAATVNAINEAVANGDITQEQADMILAKMELRALAQEIFSKDDAKQVVADTLGISVEALEAARDSGADMHELAEANDTTVDAVKEAVKAAREAAIQAAVDDGTISAEQGEELLNSGKGVGGHGKHRGHGGRNGFGGRGGPNSNTAPTQADA